MLSENNLVELLTQLTINVLYTLNYLFYNRNLTGYHMRVIFMSTVYCVKFTKQNQEEYKNFWLRLFENLDQKSFILIRVLSNACP